MYPPTPTLLLQGHLISLQARWSRKSRRRLISILQRSVVPESQSKPHAALQTPNPMTVKAGQPFTIKLKDANYLHEIKPAVIDNTDLVIPTANGTDSGEYPFFAIKAGKTKIRLLMAHESSLAVAFQDVDVIVS